jgi:hypothetical protein
MIRFNYMGQTNKYCKDITGRAITASEEKIEDMEDWRNEHGQPSFEYLQSLVGVGTPAALEKMRSIAEDLDVSCDQDTPIEELIGKIRSATRNDPNPIA